ncbi:MAG: hypothetical protein EZS28_048865 [Streblomastix strix]|uniref:Uncharacterized protein n=2 Tax=Streblomastix strix TaxID=222440 RepID=A0A5J4TBG7_9EUKA|nr:MAG: hypothetical protein EZS28_048865 [Streblomastix strix]
MIYYLGNSNQLGEQRWQKQSHFSRWGDPKIEENLSLGRPPFSFDTTERYMRSNAYDIAMRAHEAAPLGFHPAIHNGKIMTVFSSDTYDGNYSLGAVTLVRLSVPSKLHRKANRNQQIKEIYQQNLRIKKKKKKSSRSQTPPSLLSSSHKYSSSNLQTLNVNSNDSDQKEPIQYIQPYSTQLDQDVQQNIKSGGDIDQEDEIEEILPPEATHNFLPQTPMLSISVIQIESEQHLKIDPNSQLYREQAGVEEQKIRKILLDKYEKKDE